MRGNSLSAENPFRHAMLSVSPGSFALVMATGIVSVAMREVGLATVADVLLGIAAAAFVAIACAACARAALAPAAARGDLVTPSRAFASFAFVAACAVLGSGLAGIGHRVSASVLAWAGLAAWLVLTCVIPARFALARRARPGLDDVNGTWYLWAVATQSLSISASLLRDDREVPAGAAQPIAVALWSAGIAAYLGISVLVALRLHAAGLGPAGLRAPYWVSMGAASISVLAAAQILRGPGLARGAGHATVAAAGLTLWVLASGLIPILAVVTAAVSLRRPPRPRYWPGAWTMVFPLGMYAVASTQLGTAVDLPLARGIGMGEAWGAFSAWALTFALLLVSARPPWRRPGTEPTRLPERARWAVPRPRRGDRQGSRVR